MFSFLIEIEIITCKLATKGKGMHITIGVPLLRNIGRINKRSGRHVILYFIIVYMRTFFGKNFGHTVGKDFIFGKTLVSFYYLNMRVFTYYDQISRLQEHCSFVSG